LAADREGRAVDLDGWVVWIGMVLDRLNRHDLTNAALLRQAQAVRAVAACYDKREIIYQDTVDLGHRSGSGYEIPLHDLRDTL
jgi:hypothetical protein